MDENMDAAMDHPHRKNNADEKRKEPRTLIVNNGCSKSINSYVFNAWMMTKRSGQPSSHGVDEHFARECKFKGSKEGNRQEAGRGQDFKPVRTEKEALMDSLIDGELGTVSDHSVNDDLIHDHIPIPSIEQVTNTTQKTQPQMPKPTQTVDPSCAQHVKSPRQPIRTPMTSSPIPSNNRQNWNQRDLGAGYSFARKPCYVCGSLSHLIKDCDYYEKKMAREAALKSKRVVHADVRQATPAWTNTNRVNKANQFTPRPVQISNIRPNFSTASRTIKTGRVNVNTGHGNVSSGSVHVNSGHVHVNSGSVHVSSGTQIKSGTSRFNTGKQHVNSGSVHVNSGTQIKSGTSRFNTGKQHVNSGHVHVNSGSVHVNTARVNRPVSNNTSPKPSQVNLNSPKKCFSKQRSLVNRPFSRNTAHKSNKYAVKGKMGTAVKTSAGCVWRKVIPLSNTNSGPTPESNVIVSRGPQGRPKPVKAWICDKKLNVLFTKKECFVVSSDFKMPDENQVLLKVPRQHNMYTFDMKNVASSKGYTCLLAKASSDEAKLWHRRLGHLNFKNLNKLVKDNLVRGLPSKSFKNDHTCVACQKGKQHKASCKAKIDRYVTHPLHTLHMDLFGPTSVRSINHASYCLVITDDYSRSDNGTEFKNRVMLEFCGEKGIKQEFSNARTPQQNGVAERMNRTLIEAARTMLADSHLPTTFWAEAVNTACYTFNRVRVTKPQNKTPYELLFGHKPILSYIRPFGCHVTILNTLSPLGKFDGKSDEGFLVGYSVNSKAFRVYNLVTKRVEGNLHVNFLEEKPNVQGIGHMWMFDLDYLTDSMNYIPVSLQNQANPAGSKEVIDIDVPTEEAADLIVVSSFSLSWLDSINIAKKKTHSPRQPSSTPISKSADDIMTFRKELDALALKHLGPVPTIVPTSTNPLNTGSINLNTAFEEVNTGNTEANSPSTDHEEEVFSDADDDEMPEIRIYDKSSEGIFEQASYDDDGIITDFNNLPDEVDVSTNHTLRIHNAHPQSQILGDPNTPVQTRSSLKKITEAHALVSYIQAHQRSNHKDQQHCLFACFLSQFEPRKVSEALEDGSWVEAMQEELLQFKLQQVWVLVDLPNGAKVIVYVDDIIFGSTNKSWCDEFEALMQSRFQMSSMGELTFFLGLQVKQNKGGIFISQDKYVAEILKKFDLVNVKAAITPMETKLPLTKDEEAFDVDVTPKISHLNAVKRIFKYLKGKPNLGLWYPRESPLHLEAFSDSDYGGSNLDRKSTTGGCQFLGQDLYSWQCIAWMKGRSAKEHPLKNMVDRGIFDSECSGHMTVTSSVTSIYNSARIKTQVSKYDCPMAQLKYCDKHNQVGFLRKPDESAGFAEIVDFFRGSNLRYAITANPTIYDSLVKQFWQSAIANTKADGSLEINATIDTIRYTISEESIRDSLHLEDATGITMLPNDDLFEGMGKIGPPFFALYKL
ncbi:putative ribonuclease H-like domain-containing protein [Tanacetum coccineum]